MLQNSDAHIVKVAQETVEDGHKVKRGQIGADDGAEFVDGEGKGTAYLPLELSRMRRLA